jgi:hypothetical protein
MELARGLPRGAVQETEPMSQTFTFATKSQP